jgi:hypothetical protein
MSLDQMRLVRDRLLKALQKHFPATCFLIVPSDPGDSSICVEWDSGLDDNEIQAFTAPLLEGVKLYTKRSGPCFVCRAWDGTRGDEDMLVCPNCNRVLH